MKRFRKKGIALFLTAVMVAAMAPMAFADFSDIDGHQYENAVNDLGGLGVYKGYPDGTVQPNGAVTRCEYTVAVVRSVGKESLANALNNNVTSFADDASLPSWCRGAANVATAMGIVTGYPDNTFKGSNSVTHAEALVMLVRALKMGAHVGSSWPTGALVAANDLGLDTDVDVFAGVPASRGELAQMLVNTLTTDLRYDEDGNVTDGGTTPNTTLLASHFPDADPIGAKTVSGEFERITTADRIRVDGVNYEFADNDPATPGVQVGWTINEKDGATQTLAGIKTAITANNIKEDDSIVLTLNTAGKVTSLAVTRDTHGNVGLTAVAITDEDDPTEGTINVVGTTGLTIDADTEILLNGAEVTLAGLEEAFENFQDTYNDSNAIATVRTLGDEIGNSKAVLRVSVITDSIVSGKVASYGNDGNAYVRIDGNKVYLSGLIVGTDLNIGDEVTLLRGHDDKARVVLDVAADADIYFAKVLEYTVDPDTTTNAKTVTVQKADGTEVTLSAFASASTAKTVANTNLGKVVKVDISSGDATLTAPSSPVDGDRYNSSVTTYVKAQLNTTGAIITYALDESVLYYDTRSSEFVARTDLEAGEVVKIYAIDNVASYVEIQADDVAVPTVLSAAFTSATALVITFSEAVSAVTGDFTDGTQTGGTFTVDSISGSGTNVITLTVTGSETIADTDTGTVDIGVGVKDLAGNAITAVDNQAIASGF